jgi:GTP 3',8-cyclase
MNSFAIDDPTHDPERMLTQLRARRPSDPEQLRRILEDRALYFRVSVVGNCNLSCPFCHNEGGPGNGRPSVQAIEESARLAAELGFSRIQYTGGEPLLRKDLDRLVAVATRFFDDVGVTTNGTLLQLRWPSLVDAGITRVHISLQSEALRSGEVGSEWEVPEWLAWVCERRVEQRPTVRLNLPVPMGEEQQVSTFLQQLAPWGCDVKLFTLIPTDAHALQDRHAALVREVALGENKRRRVAGQRGTVGVRGHHLPTGLRCPTCRDRDMCVEQSRSLRLGSDGVLRPCLATRDWDREFDPFSDRAQETLLEATLLALDY